MSNIYEAVRQSHRELKELGLKTELPAACINEPEPPRPDMGDEMSSLFRTIESMLPCGKNKVIQFIGSRDGEGTSTVIREFARVASAKFGKAVLLLDANVSNQSYDLYFGEPEQGLSEAVKKGEKIDSVIKRIGTSSLYTGTVSKNSTPPSRFFDAYGGSNLWLSIKRRFDFILIDSPSAAASSDGIAISRFADGVILVIEAERTRWPIVASAVKKIKKNSGNILGFTLNKKRRHIPQFIYDRLT